MRLEPSDDYQERPITIEEAEADYFAEVADDLLSETNPVRIEALRKTFGFCNEKWEAFTASMQPGDELWEFCTPRESWAQLMGRHGIVLKRDGEEIDFFILLLN